MRTFFAAIVLCLASLNGFTQGSIDESMKRAQEYIDGGKYIYAIQLLDEVLIFEENDTKALFAMGEALRLSFQYEKAEAYYRKVVFLELDEYPQSMYFLALMEKFNGKYRAAADHFSQFIAAPGPDSSQERIDQARIEQAGAEMALAYHGKEKFTSRLMEAPVNSDFNDYASATRNSESMIVTSSRVTRQNKRVDQRFGEALADQYLLNTQGELWENDDESVKTLRNRYNDGSGSFTKDGKGYYFTVCGYKVRECQIYYTELNEKGEFISPEPLPEIVNIRDFDTKQPGISLGGDTLYFVSNRPGGHGGNDIWSTSKNSEGDWQTPVNMGSTVNTPMNENSPAVAMEHLLLFASNGHQGFGGMDLFIARKKLNGDTSLVNLGFPFNSSRDDMFPDISDNTFRWSSNIPTELGGFNIYETPVTSILSFTSLVNVLNRDASRRNALENPREARELTGSYATIVNKGELSFELLPPEEQRAIDALAMGENSNSASLQKWAQGQIDVLVSERQKYLSELDHRRAEIALPSSTTTGTYEVVGNIECLYCDDSPTIRLENSAGEALQISGMDETGRFKFTGLLHNQTVAIQVDPNAPGVINIERVEHLFHSDRVEFSYTPIYFRLAESIVEAEFDPIISDLASYLKENPGMHLEIVAHADNTGSAKYNDFLSRERGNFIYEKLRSFGVSPTSMMVRAKGFREPSATNSTPLGRQQNRRVEFALSGKGMSPMLNYEVCFTKEAIDKESLEALLIEENLLELNVTSLDQNPRTHLPVIVPTTMASEHLICPTSHLNK